jgi:hypothetical protein
MGKSYVKQQKSFKDAKFFLSASRITPLYNATVFRGIAFSKVKITVKEFTQFVILAVE